MGRRSIQQQSRTASGKGLRVRRPTLHQVDIRPIDVKLLASQDVVYEKVGSRVPGADGCEP